MQECYCRLAQITDVSHIDQPRAYLFTVARNILYQRLKAARVIPMERISDLDVDWPSDSPSPERAAIACDELRRVAAVLAGLSERARRIFILRKVEGMKQRDIARVLGVSENIVENEASRSLRAVLRHLTEPDAAETTASVVIRRVRRARTR